MAIQDSFLAISLTALFLPALDSGIGKGFTAGLVNCSNAVICDYLHSVTALIGADLSIRYSAQSKALAMALSP